MLIRTGFLRASKVFLLSGLLLATGEVISAQSVGKAPLEPPQPSSQQTPQAVQPAQAPGDVSAKPQASPEPVVKLADVVQKIEDEGRSTSIGSYIAQGIGIESTQTDSSPVQAHALGDSQRELCVIDDTGALLFMIKNGDTTMVYLANHAGALQLAGYFYPARFRSQEFKRVAIDKAAAGFASEKEFWIQETFHSKYGGSVKSEVPISKPDYTRSEAATNVNAGSDRKPAKQTAALKTTPTPKAAANVDEKDPSQMTAEERIKYLDKQIREAKQQAKLEKKESAKEKKLASKTAAQTAPDAKDNTSAEKTTPQTAPANSNQQSNTDGDATPPKKRISWF
jgi:hypothetical protein